MKTIETSYCYSYLIVILTLHYTTTVWNITSIFLKELGRVIVLVISDREPSKELPVTDISPTFS